MDNTISAEQIVHLFIRLVKFIFNFIDICFLSNGIRNAFSNSSEYLDESLNTESEIQHFSFYM